MLRHPYFPFIDSFSILSIRSWPGAVPATGDTGLQVALIPAGWCCEIRRGLRKKIMKLLVQPPIPLCLDCAATTVWWVTGCLPCRIRLSHSNCTPRTSSDPVLGGWTACLPVFIHACPPLSFIPGLSLLPDCDWCSVSITVTGNNWHLLYVYWMVSI